MYLTLSTIKSMESAIWDSVSVLWKLPITIFFRTTAGIIQNLAKQYKQVYHAPS